MDAGPFDGRREPCQWTRIERQPVREGQRAGHVARRDERQRDAWRVAFFAPQARPEAGIDDRFDRGSVWLRRDRAGAMRARCLAMAREICLDARRNEAGGRICRFQ